MVATCLLLGSWCEISTLSGRNHFSLKMEEPLCDLCLLPSVVCFSFPYILMPGVMKWLMTRSNPSREIDIMRNQYVRLSQVAVLKTMLCWKSIAGNQRILYIEFKDYSSIRLQFEVINILAVIKFQMTWPLRLWKDTSQCWYRPQIILKA